MDKSKSENGASVSKEFALFITEVQLVISGLLFVRNKIYQY